MPSLGRDSRSRWRTALQVLPLVISNHWNPFDPQKLLEVLTLPKSPIPRAVAGFFESALREHPGIGGPSGGRKQGRRPWHLFGALRCPGPAAGGRSAQYEKQMLFWIGDQRFDPIDGIPAKIVEALCSEVSGWAADSRLSTKTSCSRRLPYLATAVAETVAATGLTKISRPQLDRILDSVIGSGLEHPQAYAETAAWSQVMSPGQVWGHAQNIVWLDFVSPKEGAWKAPWTPAESAALQAKGVIARTPDEAAAHCSRLAEANRIRDTASDIHSTGTRRI